MGFFKLIQNNLQVIDFKGNLILKKALLSY